MVKLDGTPDSFERTLRSKDEIWKLLDSSRKHLVIDNLYTTPARAQRQGAARRFRVRPEPKHPRHQKIHLPRYPRGTQAGNAIRGCTPKSKADFVRAVQEKEQSGSTGRSKRKAHLMFIGDGTNDIVALTQADTGVSVSSSLLQMWPSARRT